MSRLPVLVLLAIVSCLAVAQAHGRDMSTPRLPMAKELFRHNASPSQWFGCYVQFDVLTGDYWRSGTDSSIRFELIDKHDASWSFLADDEYLFERGELDEFIYDGYPCFIRPCTLKVKSDGKGAGPDWFCNYVEVSVVSWETKLVQYVKRFTVSQWIGPNSGRMSVDINDCGNHGSMAVSSY